MGNLENKTKKNSWIVRFSNLFSGQSLSVPSSVKVIAYATMVLSPIVYIFIPIFVELVPRGGGEMHILFYILYFLAMVVPAMYYIIEKFQLSLFLKQKISTSPEKLFYSLSVIKFSLTLSVYVFGLIVFFVSGDAFRFYMFYPIGIIWSLVNWPTEEKFNNFMNKCKKDIYVK
ncbi:MAG: hypothetical protein U9N54_09825 [candidate division Zixibacteria bacterium]|nr:hypothetical protein [candidate division Zixibacteria bacterium]